MKNINLDQCIFISCSAKGGVGKSTWIYYLIYLLTILGYRKRLKIYDFDKEVGSTLRMNQEYDVSTEYRLSDDPSKQFQIDEILEHKTLNKTEITIVDFAAGTVSPYIDYLVQGGHQVYDELKITPVVFHPTVLSSESLSEACHFIENIHPYTKIVLCMNLLGTNNKRDEWERFCADPSIRKLSSKLNKLVEMHDVHQVYMPEIPASTYSKLQTKGISLHKALDSSNRELRLVERIRLRNLVEQLKTDFVPILENVFATTSTTT